MFHSLFTTQASRAWPALGLLMMVTGYVRGQVAPPSNLSVDLAAFDSRSAQAPANTNAFLIPITVDPPTAGGGDALHIVSTNANARISLMLPNGTEVTTANGAAQGFTFTVLTDAEAREAETPSFLALQGTHTLIEIPATALGGAYGIKVDTVGIATSTEIAVLYISASPIRLGGLANGAVYTVGQPAVLSALLANDTAAVTGATLTAKVHVVRNVSAAVTVGNYQLVGQGTGANGYAEYTYSVRATNAGAALANVQAVGNYAGGIFSAGQVVQFGSVAGGTSKNGLNTFTVGLPPGSSFTASTLTWTVTAVSAPVTISMLDSGVNDAEASDGIYTAAYTPTQVGTHSVVLTATGTSNGAPFSRVAVFEFAVIGASGSFGAFTSRGVNRESLAVGGVTNYDGIEVTANVTVPTAGRYRFTLELANTSPGVNGSDAEPINAAAVTTIASAGAAQIALVFPAESKIRIATSLTLRNARLSLLDTTPGREDREKDLVAANSAPGTIPAIVPTAFETKFAIAATGHTATLIDSTATPGIDTLRISVALTTSRLGPCSVSGVLSTTSGQKIQSVSATAGAIGQVVANVNLDFDAAYIARAGVPGPYKLSYISVICRDEQATRSNVFQTPAYTLNQFPTVANTPLTSMTRVERSSVTIAPTGEAYINVYRDPLNGAQGTTTPTSSGLPAGVQMEFAPLPWSMGRNSIRITSVNAAPGTYPVSFITLVISNTLPVQLATNPPARTLAVDGISLTSPQAFTWTAGQPHTVSIPSPQVDGTGIQWVFDKWNDLVSHDRTIAPVSSINLTAKMVQDWTQAVQVTIGPPVYDRNIALWTKTVSLRNNGATAILGRVYLGIASTVPANISLRNAADTMARLQVIQVGTQGIAAGATISGVIAYLPDSSQAPDFTLTSRVLADVPTATDVSAQTTIVRSGIIYDRAALTAQRRITITNNTSGVMNGPLTLVLTNLPAGVTLPNSFFIPGVGYVYPLPSPMAPGESIALTLLFHVDSIRPVNYTATVFSGNP